MTDKEDITNQAVAEGGSYELIQRRLSTLGDNLNQQLKQLNQNRIDTFGSTEMSVSARVRVRTEHNCVARDIAAIGDVLLFGYNVFLGLKRNITVADVFSLHKIEEHDGESQIVDLPIEGSFLADSDFVRDFDELYTYYKKTYLAHVFRQGSKVFAIFSIGERADDIRVFQWGIDSQHQVKYIDNRGERDIKRHENYDFEWLKAGRDQQEQGKHPHFNLFDELFVETIGGNLTLKVENNTEDGVGIYSEPVDDAHQSLDDAEIHYAKVGALILLKVKPYREQQTRHLIYNCKTQTVLRQDAIGHACVQLPEDHGIIFPGGYYLQSGEHKHFDDNAEDLELHRVVKSPNGEDFLYIFYEPNEGQYALFSYNLITRTLQNPVYGHGQSIYNDGHAVIFNAEAEPSRIHTMQIWQTPFCSEEHASNQPVDNSFYGRVGNPELVRGISDFYHIVKCIAQPQPSLSHYNDLVKDAKKLFDNYHWLKDSEVADLQALITQVIETSELVLDEFEKVLSIQQKSGQALANCQQSMARFNDQVQPQNFESAAQYVESLQALTEFNGEIISAKELRYIDVEALELIEQNLSTLTQILSQATADFLQKEQALAPYYQQIDNLTEQVNQATSITELSPISDEIVHLVAGLELLNHIMLSLDIEDSRQRTKILEDISAVFGQVNRVKAEAELAKKNVGSEEAKAEFGARFKLLSQSVTSALNASDSPEACDKQLSSLLVQLEELESQFSDYDEFYQEILVKRDEIYDNFEQHKQQLVDQRQRRCANLMTAAERIVQSITRRAITFKDTNKLNSYFAADPMITKLRQLIEQLRSLDDNVRADDLAAKLKNAKEQGIRALRDKTDIYSDDGSLVKIGDYQFSVNNQALELTLVPREQQMMLHIIGSDYYQALDETLFENTQHLWQQNLVSESLETYRAEYLAASILFEAESKGQAAVDALVGLAEREELAELIRVQAEARYQEGYDKGVHDVDAAAILTELLRLKSQVGLLAYSAEQRLLAIGYLYLGCDVNARQDLIQRCQNLALMTQAFGDNLLRKQLINELTSALEDFCKQQQWLAVDSTEFSVVADYLLVELANGELNFVIRKQSKELLEDFQKQLANKGLTSKIAQALVACKTAQQQYQLHSAWLSSYCQHLSQEHDTQAVPTEMMVEVCSVLLFNGDSSVIVEDTSAALNPEFYALDVDTSTSVSGLLGQHKRINDRSLVIDYQSFTNRLRQFSQIQVPAFKAFHQLKQEVLEQQRKKLRLHEFMPSALSSFVRNKLINDVYFPIIGANLAKQIGSAGADKRSDLMGLLLIISPPGYGKTTLIEYVASKLGMTFVKINCPSIGHEQVSLDPSQATNSTARSEVEKINLAFEMGNNVMLYLDDIQHTNPEFLQKFISLCDGSRKVDGVWNGESKTYDMRGKKFAVVMAGNPYTESGEAFTIPDMLANRADIYNLGDTLSGREHEFSLSFIENSLTSNPYLAPLAMRDMEDLYQLVKLADGNSVGEEASASNLQHGYSQAEVNEIVAVIKRIRHIQKTVLKANEQYIKSAAQDDKYRTEPPFKLQGSYRNMNKMAEKVVPVMTEQELEQLIGDHYRGEAQTLTVGAEENLLKLAELRDKLTSDQAQRWQQIKSDYARHQSLGDEEDSVKAIANQIALLKDSLNQIAGSITISQGDAKGLKDIENTLASLQSSTNNALGD